MKSKDAYKAVEKNLSGSRPKELFEDVLEEVEEQYEHDRALLKEATRKDVVVTLATSFGDFQSALDEFEDGKLSKIAETSRCGLLVRAFLHCDVPAAHEAVLRQKWLCRKLYFEELVGRLKEKEATEEKKRKRAREDFQELLRDMRSLKHDTTWAEAKAVLEKEPEYKAVRLLSFSQWICVMECGRI